MKCTSICRHTVCPIVCQSARLLRVTVACLLIRLTSCANLMYHSLVCGGGAIPKAFRNRNPHRSHDSTCIIARSFFPRRRQRRRSMETYTVMYRIQVFISCLMARRYFFFSCSDARCSAWPVTSDCRASGICPPSLGAGLPCNVNAAPAPPAGCPCAHAAALGVEPCALPADETRAHPPAARTPLPPPCRFRAPAERTPSPVRAFSR